MQVLLFAAGSLALLTGLAHSVLGELLIFRRLRSGGIVPTISTSALSEGNIRIIWATWHLASVFGWAFAAILLKLAAEPLDFTIMHFVLIAICLAHLGAALLVLIGTQGRHPGWIALTGVAVLTGLAAL